AQRGAPIWLRRPVGVDFASASRAPPLDAVGAAPGRWLHQVYRRRGWVGGQRGREVRDLGLAGPLEAMDDGGECLIGAFVMVAEGLAIDRDAGERARRRSLECFGQAIGVGGERAEGDVVRQHAVVPED